VEPVKILYVIGTLDIGGAEQQLVQLVSRLDRRRFRPVVCSLASGGPYADTLAAAGVPVRIVGFRGLNRGIWTLRYLPRILAELRGLVTLIRAERPAIVHGFLFWAYVIGTFAARRAAVPIVVASRRSLGCFKAAKPHYLWLERLANRRTNLLVANSEAVKQDVMVREGVPSARIRVVYNGIDAERYERRARPQMRAELEIPAGAPVVGVVANLIHYKGHRFLLQAFQRVHAWRPGTVLLLAGDGPCRPELERLAEELGIVEMVRFLGTRRDIPELLAATDVVVLPSLEEGFPNAVLEAMAAGKPVVASAVGGIPEAVVHEATGLLVPPGDPTALAEAILAVVGDPARAEQMGRAGQARAKDRFGMERMVTETEAIYEELLGAARH
jgi:glycosyltransferase involved in cell wall biosynthesis